MPAAYAYLPNQVLTHAKREVKGSGQSRQRKTAPNLTGDARLEFLRNMRERIERAG